MFFIPDRKLDPVASGPVGPALGTLDLFIRYTI